MSHPDSSTAAMQAIREFLAKAQEGISPKEFASDTERLAWVRATLSRVRYEVLPREDKGLVRQYLGSVAGYSRAQVARHIRRHRFGNIVIARLPFGRPQWMSVECVMRAAKHPRAILILLLLTVVTASARSVSTLPATLLSRGGESAEAAPEKSDKKERGTSARTFASDTSEATLDPIFNTFVALGGSDRADDGPSGLRRSAEEQRQKRLRERLAQREEAASQPEARNTQASTRAATPSSSETTVSGGSASVVSSLVDKLLAALGGGQNGQVLMFQNGAISWGSPGNSGGGRRPSGRGDGSGDSGSDSGGSAGSGGSGGGSGGGGGGGNQVTDANDGNIEGHDHQDSDGGGSLDINPATTGTLRVDRGGTGQKTYGTGNLLVGTAGASLAVLSASTNSGYVLTVFSGGVVRWARTGGGNGDLTLASASALFVNVSGDAMTGTLIIKSGAGLNASGSLLTNTNLTLNSDAGAANAVLTFGSDGTNETLTFLNAEDRFEFSDDLNATGNLTASGTFIAAGTGSVKAETFKINSDQSAGDTVLVFGSDTTNETLKFLNTEDKFSLSDDLRILGNLSGSSLNVDGYTGLYGGLTVSGAVILKSTLRINGVTYTFPSADGTSSGKVLKTNSAGLLSWSTDASGVAGQGITVVGSIFSLSSAFSGTSLEIIGTASGRILHAQDELRSSGSLVVEGATVLNGGLTLQRSGITDTPITIVSSGSLTAMALSGGSIIHEARGNPVLKGTYNTSGTAYGVAIAGRYAYVADDDVGLRIIDISNPASPALIGTYDTSGNAWQVAIAGRYAYVADDTAGLQIIDVSKPNTPTLVGTYNTTDNAYDVAIVGRYAYVADDNDGLQIIDISNPASPTLIGIYDVVGSDSHGVAIAGRYAYVADKSAGLKIIDISNPASPTLTGTYAASNAAEVAIAGRYAYVVAPGGVLSIVDISNSSSPSLVGTYTPVTGPYSIAVAGRYAYLAIDGNGIEIVDVSTPASPTLVGRYNTSGNARGVAVTGRYAYVVDASSGLQILELNGLDTPTATIGALDVYGLNVLESARINSNLVVDRGLNVGDGLYVYGQTAMRASSGSALVLSTKDKANTAALFVSGSVLISRTGSGRAIPDTGLSLEVIGAMSGRILYATDELRSSGTLVISGTGSVKAETFKINSDASAGDTVLVFGSDTTNETLKFLNVEDKFSLSDDLRILGNLSGSSLNVDGYTGLYGGLTVSGAVILKSTLQINGVAYTFPAADGSASGKVLKTNSAGLLSWSTDSSGTTYVAGQGITISSTVLSLSSAFSGTSLEIIGTASGRILHAQDELRSSGSLVVEGLTVLNGGLRLQRSANTDTPITIVSSGSLTAMALSGGSIIHEARGNPVLRGTYDTSGNALGVAIAGRYAYVGDGSAGLRIVDISNPASPTLVGTYDTSGTAYDVDVAGRYAYVADNASGLQVIDISNPASPTLTGTYNTPGIAYAVAVAGRYAYVADQYNGLQIIDISNPASPTLIANHTAPGNAVSVAVAGRYAYVAHENSGLRVIDISNPASPTLIATYAASGGAFGVAIAGRYAYIAADASGLRVIDISNPASPTLTGTYDTSGFAEGDIAIAGRYAYVTDYYDLKIIDISNPASPTLVGTYDTSGNANTTVAVAGRYAYVADASAGLQILELSGLDTPTASIGALEVYGLQVIESGRFNSNLVVDRGLNVGDGMYVYGQTTLFTQSGTALTIASRDKGTNGTGGVALNVTSGSVVIGTGATGMKTTSGSLMIGTKDAYNKPAIVINTDETSGGQTLFRIISDVGSTNNDVFRINASGSVFSDNAYISGGADYAEWFYSGTEKLVPGEVVCIDVTKSNTVKRCQRDGDSDVMGVVSTNPAFVGNSISGADGLLPPGYSLIGLIGQVPTKVTVASPATGSPLRSSGATEGQAGTLSSSGATEGQAGTLSSSGATEAQTDGTIRPGDALTASAIPGIARKAQAGESTIGVALEGLESGEGIINVLISRRNQSMTAEAVEERILESIANMEIEDEVQIMLAKSLENLNVNGQITDEVRSQVDGLDLSAQMRSILGERLGTGSILGKAENVLSMTEENTLELRSSLQVMNDATFNGSVSILGQLSGLSLELEKNLTVGGSARIGKDLHVDGTVVADRIMSPNELFVDGDIAVGGIIRAAGIELATGATLNLPGSLTLNGTLTVENLDIGGSLSLESLIVRDGLEVLGDITISGLARFLGDVDVAGQLIVSNRQAGYAKIPKTGTAVTVVFGSGFTVQPIVSASPDVPVLFGVSKATMTGFTIRLGAPATEDITFSWMALATAVPETTVGGTGTGTVSMKPFTVDAQGIPYSAENPAFNACIRNQTLLDDSGQPYNCGRYHTDTYRWILEDGSAFTYRNDLTPPLLVLPEGYEIVVVGVEEEETMDNGQLPMDNEGTGSGALITESGSIIVAPEETEEPMDNGQLPMDNEATVSEEESSETEAVIEQEAPVEESEPAAEPVETSQEAEPAEEPELDSVSEEPVDDATEEAATPVEAPSATEAIPMSVAEPTPVTEEAAPSATP